MAQVVLRIHYATRFGEELLVEWVLASGDRAGRTTALVPMRYAGEGFWALSLESAGAGIPLRYRYVFRNDRGEVLREPTFRELETGSEAQRIQDEWFAPQSADAALIRQAFAGIIFPISSYGAPLAAVPARGTLRITLRAPRVANGFSVCVSGAHPALGGWDPARALVMSGAGYPLWQLDLPLAEFALPSDFKFGLWSLSEGRLVQYETGANRLLPSAQPGQETVRCNCEQFRHPTPWRGAGVAVPVFALRSEQSHGIGEFLDLVPFVGWAADCGMQMVQLLPVNDTSADFSWRDSYPYKAISSMALHPIYAHLDDVYRRARLPVPAKLRRRRQALNLLPEIDYEAVLADKLAALREVYSKAGHATLDSGVFRAFWKQHGDWLRPYAAFCRLRDQHQTADFSRWGEDATYREGRLRAWFKPGSPEHDEVMFHCFVQFHLDRQLGQAIAAAHARGVAFKGDLPIGIDRCSVEAWTEPKLFHMDRQTGAPPDSFARLGQNWGFPTYDWQRMAQDGYAWWQRRFERMSACFDAVRIDHVLGFFRIWEIPLGLTEGILGHFNPALPLSRAELFARGFPRDPKRFCQPGATEAALVALFGVTWQRAADAFLVREDDGCFRIRPGFERAAVRREVYAGGFADAEAKAVETGMAELEFEVLFVEDPERPEYFHPRITLPTTALFQSLEPAEQAVLRELHDDFYFRRHTRFWGEQGLLKLPAMQAATTMLICAEDLGMIPACVPEVLDRLGMLTLEVQSMPKRFGQLFGNPAEYPYFSVCTTSTHDMPTVRGWWEESETVRQAFWNQVMGRPGSAPAECAPDICRFIVEQNLAGASMWCILPLQDWLGMDGTLRRAAATEERINVPANSRHYWRYRMHLTVEELARHQEFGATVAQLIRTTGRSPDR